MRELRTSLFKQFAVMSLTLAWLGIWGTWVWHPTISLSQSALDLAEWATFLPEVRFGGLTRAPELLRFGVAAECIALAFATGKVNSPTLRWTLRIITLLPGAFMLPPYPDVLRLWWSDSYGLRFTAASLVLLGVILSPTYARLKIPFRELVVGAFCFGGIGATVWGLILLLPPFAALYSSVIMPGWGLIVFLAGLTAAIISQGIDWRGSRRQRSDV